MEILRKDALDYHRLGRKGKIEVTSTKPCRTQRDLSLAYTPGVAEPCNEIHKNPDGEGTTAEAEAIDVVTRLPISTDEFVQVDDIAFEAPSEGAPDRGKVFVG